jgi:hypothetical protein
MQAMDGFLFWLAGDLNAFKDVTSCKGSELLDILLKIIAYLRPILIRTTVSSQYEYHPTFTQCHSLALHSIASPRSNS